MMKEMITEITPGTGINLEEVLHGEMLREQSYQLQRKPISFKTPTSLTLNEHSKAWSPNRTTQISPLSSGETSWQTDRLTL